MSCREQKTFLHFGYTLLHTAIQEKQRQANYHFTKCQFVNLRVHLISLSFSKLSPKLKVTLL